MPQRISTKYEGIGAEVFDLQNDQNFAILVALQQDVTQTFDQLLVQELCGTCRNYFEELLKNFLKKKLATS